MFVPDLTINGKQTVVSILRARRISNAVFANGNATRWVVEPLVAIKFVQQMAVRGASKTAFFPVIRREL